MSDDFVTNAREYARLNAGLDAARRQVSLAEEEVRRLTTLQERVRGALEKVVGPNVEKRLALVGNESAVLVEHRGNYVSVNILPAPEQ